MDEKYVTENVENDEGAKSVGVASGGFEEARIVDADKDREDDFTVLNPDEDDDETTIAAEEALGEEMQPEEELKLLAQDLEIGVEELKSRSGCLRPRRRKQVEPEPEPMEQVWVDNSEYVVSSQPGPSGGLSGSPSPTSQCDGDNGGTELAEFYLASPDILSDEDDVEYQPLLKPNPRAVIRIGPEFQAHLPSNWPNFEEHETCEEVVWNQPEDLTDEGVCSYISAVERMGLNKSILERLNLQNVDLKNVDLDYELALDYLKNCDYDSDLALKRVENNLEYFVLHIRKKQVDRRLFKIDFQQTEPNENLSEAEAEKEKRKLARYEEDMITPQNVLVKDDAVNSLWNDKDRPNLVPGEPK